MDGGSVDIHVRMDVAALRRDVAAAKTEIKSISNVSVRSQFDPLLRDVQAMKQRAAGLSAELAGMDVAQKRTVASSSVLAGGLSTLALRAGVVTAAVGLGIRELDQFSDALAKTNQRAQAAGVELHGVAGAAANVNQGFRSFLSEELDHLGQAVGFERERIRLAEARLKTQQEMVAWVARENETLRDGSQIAVREIPNDRAGMQGPGLADSIRRTNAPAGYGLSQRLRTAIDIAYTTPGTGDEIAQLRRAQKALRGQLSGGGLHTDQARSAVAQQLRDVQDQLAALTKPTKSKTGTTSGQSVQELRLENKRARAALTERTTDDIEAVKAQIAYYKSVVENTKGVAREQARASQIAKQAELANLQKPQTMTATVDPASTVGTLGQGPLLAGPVGEFAQSYGYKPRARDYVADLKAQVKAGQGFNQDLATLGNKGLGKAARAEIAGMGEAGQQLADTLSRAPKSTVRAFERQYERRAVVATRTTQEQVSVQANVVNISGATINVAGDGDGKTKPKAPKGKTHGDGKPAGAERFTSGPHDR